MHREGDTLSISQVKEKLKSNPDLIVSVLEKLGCHNINPSRNQKEIRCALPDAHNDSSIQILLDNNITCNVYSRADYDGGSIIDFIAYIKKIKFSLALQWLCKQLGIDYTYEPVQECETFKYFKKFSRHISQPKLHDILDKSILNQYKKQKIKSWLDEGINETTQQKYEVMYDSKSNRIVFPIYDDNKNLINIKGRTCYPNYKELGIKKYIHYYTVGTPDILFGMWFNRQSIINLKEVILFEAEKSVMKCDSLGIYNVLSVGTHTITEYQIPKLLQLHCDIVIAFDKDVTYKELIKQANKLNKYTNVYIIWDKNNLLGEKDAPIDKGLEVWEQLYNERVKII